jgi:peptide/nickel transport system substrate-binding protein
MSTRGGRHPGLLVALSVALAVTACTGDEPGGGPVLGEAAELDDLAAGPLPDYEPPHDQPGPAVDRLRFRSFDVDRAPRELAAGNMDLYLFSLKTAAAEELRDDSDVQLYQAPSTTLSLVLNPAPAPDGRLNPFAIREVRQAMQYLVDRDFIARDIFRGRAAPMATHLSPREFDFVTIHDLDRGSGIGFDPEFARRQISDAMTDAGAELVDGRWHYQGQPVRLTFVGRVEDERRDITDLIRIELEAAGFEVGVTYQPFAPATLQVYSSDPAAQGWHLYTEGWGRSAPQRYDVGLINQMSAPWMGNLPGWQEVGFWQYEHERLDELGQQLFRGEFGSEQERNEIYREMTGLALEESVRIWLVTAVDHFPARSDLVGVTPDFGAGPRSPWALREAYAPGKEDLDVGHLWVWTERTTWNPIGGFGDVYSVDVWRNLFDPPIWNHPFTGTPMPMRAGFEVETAGPDGTIDVPTDAVIWDAEADRWRAVPSGTTAVSRVVFDYSGYLGSRWHHGVPITMADVVYGIAQSHDRTYDSDKSRIETAMAVTTRPYLDTFRGYRVAGDDRLEVYVDYWHFDEAHIAGYASPTGLTTPWELQFAMDLLVFEERRAAYSDTAAARFNVPWLSLVMERDARLVERTLRDLQASGRVPDGELTVGTGSLVDAASAAERYEAALAWVDEYRHLVISNGPFLLTAYDPPAQFAELQAFRDETYPFRPGDWYFGDPPVLRVADVSHGELSAGDDARITVAVEGPGELGVSYLLQDLATGELVAQGTAEDGGNGEFWVNLDPSVTAALNPGLHRLRLAAHSDEVAVVAEHTTDLDVTGG